MVPPFTNTYVGFNWFIHFVFTENYDNWRLANRMKNRCYLPVTLTAFPLWWWIQDGVCLQSGQQDVCHYRGCPSRLSKLHRRAVSAVGSCWRALSSGTPARPLTFLYAMLQSVIRIYTLSSVRVSKPQVIALQAVLLENARFFICEE